MKLEYAIDGLKIALEEHDSSVAFDVSIEGEGAEVWDEIEVNAEAVRALLKAISVFTDAGCKHDALNSAVGVLRQKQAQPHCSVQHCLWESIKDYAERAIG